MIVKIRGTNAESEWLIFEVNGGFVRYSHEMLSVNDIHRGRRIFDEQGNEVGCFGLGLDEHIVAVGDCPAWGRVLSADERDPECDVEHPFVLLSIVKNKGKEEEDMFRILFNTVAYICNDEGKTIEKVSPNWRMARNS